MAGLSIGDAAVVITSSAGVALQFIQTEDPTFPLTYFTVLSAVLLPVAAVMRVVGERRFSRLIAYAGQAGTLTSALVYWGVIAPANGIGSATLTMCANVSLHAIAPVAMLYQACSDSELIGMATFRDRVHSLWFPGIYLAGSLTSQLMGQAATYSFLDVRNTSVLSVVGAAIGAGLIYLASGATLDRIRQWARADDT